MRTVEEFVGDRIKVSAGGYGDPRQGPIVLRLASESVEHVQEGLSETGLCASFSSNAARWLALELMRAADKADGRAAAVDSTGETR